MTAAGYEKMVLTVNEWIAEQGYDAFAEVVEMTPQRYRVQLISEEGTPRTRLGLLPSSRGRRLTVCRSEK